MSTTIFYFSATGNSLFIAKKIAKEMGSVKLISIRDTIKEERIECDSGNIGIIFPVYFFGLPIIVSEFIKKLKLEQSQYCFGIAVHGGESGNALYQLKKECNNTGINLKYAKDLETCGAYIVLYNPQKPEEFTYGDELQQKVKSIICDISKHMTDMSCVKYHPIFRMIYIISSKRWKKADKNFTYDKKCKACGVCEKVCPISNIIMKDGHPDWQQNCMHCMACIHWCPCDSIQYKKHTIGKNRYRNPFITLEEMGVKE